MEANLPFKHLIYLISMTKLPPNLIIYHVFSIKIDSRNAWAWIFHRRWRGRLGISLRGYDFHNVLRYDYITDWIASMLFFNLMTGSLMSMIFYFFLIK